MKKTVKIVALLLTLLMLLPAAAACSKNDESGANGTVSTDPGATGDLGLPDANFEGYEFTYAARGAAADNLSYYDAMDLTAEDLTSEPVNDAIYKRNAEVCAKYNFKIVVEYVGTCSGKTGLGSDMSKYIEKLIRSGDAGYDAIVAATQETVGYSMQNWLVDLNTVEHLSLDETWWDQNVSRDLTVGNKVYMATGDIITGDKKGAVATLFNKQLVAQLGLADQYQLVRDGDWTLETFYENSKSATADTDPNNANSKTDRYGYLVWKDSMVNFVNGTGNAVGRISYGSVFEFTIANGTMIDVWDEMVQFLKSGSAYNVYNNYSQFASNADSSYDAALKHFLEGNHCLYAFTAIGGISKTRTYNADVGVLPSPKLDKDQTEYITGINPWGVNFISIPTTNNNTSRTGHILEALAIKGQEILRPAFYEVNLKSKSATDYESAEMLDIIFDTRFYDAGTCFQWGDFSTTLQNLFVAEDSALQRTVTTNTDIVRKDIEKQMILFGMN